MESDAIHNTVVRSLNATKWVPPLQKIGVIARIDIVHSRHTFFRERTVGMQQRRAMGVARMHAKTLSTVYTLISQGTLSA